MSAENTLAARIIGALAVQDGRLVLPDETLFALAREIEASSDRGTHAVALIALAKRLQALPGSGPATEAVTALAALALGDAEAKAALLPPPGQ